MKKPNHHAKKIGRPPGKKERKPRQRRQRIVIPAGQEWLNWREAESDSGLSRNKLRPHLAAIGAKKAGARVIFNRKRLHAWLESLPSA